MPLEQTLRELSPVAQTALRQRFSKEQRRLKRRVKANFRVRIDCFRNVLGAHNVGGARPPLVCSNGLLGSVHWAHVALGVLELKARDKCGPAPPPERVT